MFCKQMDIFTVGLIFCGVKRISFNIFKNIYIYKLKKERNVMS